MCHIEIIPHQILNNNLKRPMTFQRIVFFSIFQMSFGESFYSQHFYYRATSDSFQIRQWGVWWISDTTDKVWEEYLKT